MGDASRPRFELAGGFLKAGQNLCVVLGAGRVQLFGTLSLEQTAGGKKMPPRLAEPGNARACGVQSRAGGDQPMRSSIPAWASSPALARRGISGDLRPQIFISDVVRLWSRTA